MKNQKIKTSEYLRLDKDSKNVIKYLNSLIKKIENKEIQIYECNEICHQLLQDRINTEIMMPKDTGGYPYNSICLSYKRK